MPDVILAPKVEMKPITPLPIPPEKVLPSVIPPQVAQPETPEIPKPVSYPKEGNVLLACKRDRTLYVYKNEDSTWKRLAAFPMAIGRNSGDKGDNGDLRTPEGRFWITSLGAGPEKGPMYGPLIFKLNYPRPGDLADGKTGNGIWIHGVIMGNQPTYTHGCLSLANEDILALAAYADIATPVIILSDSLAPDPAHQIDLVGMESEYPAIAEAYARKSQSESDSKDKILEQARKYVAKEAKAFPELAMRPLTDEDRKDILTRLEQWRTDWTSRSIDAYAANYDASFRDKQGRDKKSFLDRKRKIFGAKSKIEMEIKEPRIESETYSRVKVTFRQDYVAIAPQGVQRSSEFKSLRLDQGPGGWLIITE